MKYICEKCGEIPEDQVSVSVYEGPVMREIYYITRGKYPDPCIKKYTFLNHLYSVHVPPEFPDQIGCLSTTETKGCSSSVTKKD